DGPAVPRWPGRMYSTTSRTSTSAAPSSAAVRSQSRAAASCGRSAASVASVRSLATSAMMKSLQVLLMRFTDAVSGPAASASSAVSRGTPRASASASTSPASVTPPTAALMRTILRAAPEPAGPQRTTVPRQLRRYLACRRTDPAGRRSPRPAAAAGSANRIRPGGEGVIALGPNRPGQRAPRVLADLELVEHPAEVVGGPPAQRGAGAGVDINAVDHAEHRPAAPRVFRVGVGEQAPHDRGGVPAQAGPVAGRERRGGADDVPSEADRGRPGHGEQVG